VLNEADGTSAKKREKSNNVTILYQKYPKNESPEPAISGFFPGRSDSITGFDQLKKSFQDSSVGGIIDFGGARFFRPQNMRGFPADIRPDDAVSNPHGP
jgi:hypothetical protein